jgi:hypothetical protein
MARNEEKSIIYDKEMKIEKECFRQLKIKYQ